MNDRSARRILLEVCVGSLADAQAAAKAGADRLELCSALELGGLTPSLALVEQVLGEVDLPVFVMARPRGGGFCYSSDETRCMRRDAELALAAGASGIVFGFLNASGEVDAVRRVRGKRAAIPALVDDMLKRSAGFDRIDVAILHADSERDAERLARTVRESRSGITGMQTVGIGAVIGAHVGPGALGIAFLAR